MNKILVSGFEPFGIFRDNASQLVVEALAGKRLRGIEITPVVLPVSYERSFAVLQPYLGSAFDRVVLLGMYAGEAAFRVERLAINLADEAKPDNDGRKNRDAQLIPGAPAAYFATLNLRGMERRLSQAGYQVKLSLSAGTYVCNALLFKALHYIDSNGLNLPAGFIHLPAPIVAHRKLPSSIPRLGLETITEAVIQALRAC